MDDVRGLGKRARVIAYSKMQVFGAFLGDDRNESRAVRDVEKVSALTAPRFTSTTVHGSTFLALTFMR
ncbi:MAG: hypothetical protein ACXW3X_16425 [Rhodoplanes sp.]